MQLSQCLGFLFEGKETKRNESMARARSNVVKTLATVAFFFIFCWTWNQTYYLMFYLDYPLIDFTSAFYNFTVIMVFLNCCVNPIIYSIKYEQVPQTLLHCYTLHTYIINLSSLIKLYKRLAR